MQQNNPNVDCGQQIEDVTAIFWRMTTNDHEAVILTKFLDSDCVVCRDLTQSEGTFIGHKEPHEVGG